MAVILLFLGGQFMYGGFNEFRIFMQMLPLSLILLSERWQEYAGSGMATQLPLESAPAWAVRGTFPVLIPMAIVLMGLSTVVPAWRYQTLCESIKPDHQARTIATLKTKAENGDAQAQYFLAKCYVKGEGVPVNLTESFRWFHKATQQGMLRLNTSWACVTSKAKEHQKTNEAGNDWFRKATAQGNTDAQYDLGYVTKMVLGVKRDLPKPSSGINAPGKRAMPSPKTSWE